jgi:phospholipid/cholesterol/gamma-HCH transport system substrate-binding protein
MNPSPVLPPRSGTGLFLLSGGLLALALLVGLAREQRWGEPTFPVLLQTDRAEGLRPGMAVRISGLPVGTVRQLILQDNARVALRLEIAQRHRHLIGPGSVAWQGQEGFVGEHYVGITPRPLPRGAPTPAAGEVRLPFEPAPDVRTVVKQFLASQQVLDLTLRQTRQLTARDVPQTLGSFRRSLAAVEQLSTRVGEEVPPALASVRHSLGRIDNLAGSLQREATLTGPPLRRTLQQAGSTAEGAAGTVQEAELLMRQSREPLLQTLKDLQQITSGLSRLLSPLLGRGDPQTPGSGDAEPAGEGEAGVRRQPSTSPSPGAQRRDDPHPRMPPLP